MEKFVVKIFNRNVRWFEHEYIFRFDPVPLVTHNTVGHRMYRRPQTTQERRYNIAHKKYTRGKRRNIPQAWDDIYFSCAYPKGWKDASKRRHQWKERR
jgi:hypothetical protein